jgi:hypothetical protein
MGTRRSQGPRSPGRTLATHSCATSLSSPRVLQVFPVGSSSSLGCSHTSRTRTRSRPARCHSRLRLGTRSNSRGYNCDWPHFAYPHNTRHRTYTTPYHPALSPSHISESQNLHYQYITCFPHSPTAAYILNTKPPKHHLLYHTFWIYLITRLSIYRQCSTFSFPLFSPTSSLLHYLFWLLVALLSVELDIGLGIDYGFVVYQ